jgi:hypothetical protein
MKSGKLIRNGKGEHLFVFSMVEPNAERFELYPSYIGYNLTIDRVDEFKPTSPVVSACLSELSDDEQLALAEMIPVRREIAAHTVAVTAKARSGKNHLADVIRGKYHKTSVVRALAEPIREIAYSICGDVKGKNHEMLILIGQGLREKDPNIWIKAWLRRNIEDYLEKKANKFICQDLQEPNEYYFFKNLGAVIVGIETDEELRLAKIAELDGNENLNATLLKDETERNAGLYEMDYVLVNNYDNQFNINIKEFVDNVLVAKKGW